MTAGWSSRMFAKLVSAAVVFALVAGPLAGSGNAEAAFCYQSKWVSVNSLPSTGLYTVPAYNIPNGGVVGSAYNENGEVVNDNFNVSMSWNSPFETVRLRLMSSVNPTLLGVNGWVVVSKNVCP